MTRIELLQSEIERKLPRFFARELGWSAEETFREFNAPEVGKKSEFVKTDFDFSSLVGLSAGRPDKHSVAKFMSEELGRDYESSWMELSMPKVKKSGSDSFGVKTFTPGEMAAIRGASFF